MDVICSVPIKYFVLKRSQMMWYVHMYMIKNLMNHSEESF